MKISPLIYDFRSQLPSYQASHEYTTHWVTTAHAQAEVRALGRMDLLPEWGFRMTLSREVPDKIAAALPGFLERLLESAGVSPQAHRDRIIFAIHPGGPKIIDSVQKLFNLNDDLIASSRAVLFERGNMSSATLPHIWAKILADAGVRPGTHVVSLAFGPGLTVAGALFKKW